MKVYPPVKLEVFVDDITSFMVEMRSCQELRRRC